MKFRDFDALIGQNSYVLCKGKVRKVKGVVPYNAAKQHISQGGQIGWWVRPGYIVVDIDEGKEQALQIVNRLGLKTLMCQTPKGLHLYFKTDKQFPQKVGMVLPCGLKCDFRCAGKGYVLLPYGSQGRRFNKCHEIAMLPWEFTPMIGCKESLLGLREGDGRNDMLFRHLLTWKSRGDTTDEQIIEMTHVINDIVFQEPMDDEEVVKLIKSILRYEINSEGEESSELETITARELFHKDIPDLIFLVEGLIPQGLTILSGPPKYGKSWMCLDIAFSVADGVPFLGHNTRKAGVLYLALEDGYRRLKQRMNLMLQGHEPPEGVHFAIQSSTIDKGLSFQIEQYVKKYPDTGIVLIDVFQNVRSSHHGNSKNIYAADYADIRALKRIADAYHMVVLLVHHNRKMKDDADRHNQVSGSTGLVGAADTTMVINKKARSDRRAELSITGRDVETADLVIELDLQHTYRWRVVATREQIEQDQSRMEYESNPLVKTIKDLLSVTNFIRLTPSELMELLPVEMNIEDVRGIGHAINRVRDDLLRWDGISYSKGGSSKQHYHCFRRVRVKVDFGKIAR